MPALAREMLGPGELPGNLGFEARFDGSPDTRMSLTY
ncbi:hypothetical protein HEB29_005519 [Streptomyces fulvorobeus]|uniref:Uncharacterized protein n=1 Tax=Streptomyces fulvorobeus TaxID=284028 RepID=A0A7Y9HHT3_9ACTN|nr:hypothetical protein [Streptomyces fulvorobeus]